mmetsp:Transcript_38521/g.43160  ORF Transcript_38521/g.43160 Transcript_38521/m.43160 type:complete len:214 (+) Transcript_38521:163-804(+)
MLDDEVVQLIHAAAAAAAAAATATTDDDDAAAAATPDDDAAATADDTAANGMTVTATIDMDVPQSVVKSIVDTVASEVWKKLVLKKQSVVNIDECWINDQKLAPTHTTVDVDDDVPHLHNRLVDDDSTDYDSQSGDGSTDDGMDDDNGSLNLLESSSEEDDDDNDIDDEAGDLPVAPVAATYEVNQGEEEIYELSQAMNIQNMLHTHQDYNNN